MSRFRGHARIVEQIERELGMVYRYCNAVIQRLDSAFRVLNHAHIYSDLGGIQIIAMVKTICVKHANDKPPIFSSMSKQISITKPPKHNGNEIFSLICS